MSSENDVPLGEGSRRYYEQQFGDRIRQVSKSGGKNINSGGSNWNGRGIVGIVIGIIFIIRLIIGFGGSGRQGTQSQVDFNANHGRMEQLLKVQNQDDPFRFRNDVPDFAFLPNENPLLKNEDVPLLAGLCYRINRERMRPEPTRGGQIYKLLDEFSRKLLVKSAERDNLDAEERTLLLAGLNKVLDRADFYDEAAFRDVQGIVQLRLDQNLDFLPFDGQSVNRQCLEKCYPEQIVPYRERASLKEKQMEWLTRAHLDLLRAREEFEGVKR